MQPANIHCASGTQSRTVGTLIVNTSVDATRKLDTSIKMDTSGMRIQCTRSMHPVSRKMHKDGFSSKKDPHMYRN